VEKLFLSGRPSAGSVLSPALLTCRQHFVQVRSRPYLNWSKPILKAWKLGDKLNGVGIEVGQIAPQWCKMVL